MRRNTSPLRVGIIISTEDFSVRGIALQLGCHRGAGLMSLHCLQAPLMSVDKQQRWWRGKTILALRHRSQSSEGNVANNHGYGLLQQLTMTTGWCDCPRIWFYSGCLHVTTLGNNELWKWRPSSLVTWFWAHGDNSSSNKNIISGIYKPFSVGWQQQRSGARNTLQWLRMPLTAAVQKKKDRRLLLDRR